MLVRARYAGFAILLVIVALLAVLLLVSQASLPVHEETLIRFGACNSRSVSSATVTAFRTSSQRTNRCDVSRSLPRMPRTGCGKMEMNRRIAAGRLGRSAGESALDTDKFLRTIVLPHCAKASIRIWTPSIAICSMPMRPVLTRT